MLPGMAVMRAVQGSAFPRGCRSLAGMVRRGRGLGVVPQVGRERNHQNVMDGAAAWKYTIFQCFNTQPAPRALGAPRARLARDRMLTREF
jgi:hypothetical protein